MESEAAQHRKQQQGTKIKVVEEELLEGYIADGKFVLTERELDGVVVQKKVNTKKQIKYKDLNQIREDDYVICKDGTRVTRIDFIENGEHIKACQWIQEEDGKVEIRIVPDKGFTEKDRLYVVRETERKVGQGNLDINTIIVSIDKLIYTRRGKFKLIVRK